MSETPRSRRARWMLTLVVAALIAVCLPSPRFRGRAARVKLDVIVERIEQRLAQFPQFADVHIYLTEEPKAVIAGSVETEADRRAVIAEVEEINPFDWYIFAMHVRSPPTTLPWKRAEAATAPD